EKFIERARQWRELYGDIIYKQFRALGFGPDWQRDRYTMDEGLSKAVVKVFVQLYNEGLIYRGTRLVNWCPRCGSTLADTEVEHEDTPGTLYYVRYRTEDGGDGVVIATTRPETIFADVAIAVHPDDPRYQSLIGKLVKRPLSPHAIPVIADAAVERSFGTGALKITPGHDQADAEIGERHGLASISVIGPDAKMTDAVEQEFVGLDRFDARTRAVETLRTRGALVKEEPYMVSTGTCYRCDTVIEPLLSLQWFVKIKPLAEPALVAAQHGKLAFVPERFSRTYEDWLEHIRDWCISRQIWWGHRLPVWYCSGGHVTVSKSTPPSCAECGDRSLTQDPDTLDTWFSSGLWPFSILGWPEDTPELRAWYPNQVLVTAREIIFNWVARMVMFGIHFAGDIPFKRVFIAPLVLDEQGRKMSKSLGNSLDPMDLVRDYGADATRFAIVSQMHGGQDVRFSIAKCDDARKFCNKLWQAARFAIDLANEGRPGPSAPLLSVPDETSWTLPDRWIMDALARTAARVTQALEAFDFAEAAQTLYTFVWNQACDVYIEIAKDKAPTRAPILTHALATALQLLHPIMPFVTEELWGRLGREGFIGESAWPSPSSGWLDEQARDDMSRLLDFVEAVRALRALPKLPYRELRDVTIVGADKSFVDLLQRERGVIARLARAENVHAPSGPDGRPKHALSRRLGAMEVLLPVDEAFVEKERMALDKEIARAKDEADAIERKLQTNFVDKAPAAVVEQERARLADLKQGLAMSEDRRAALK
ncbi:MAG TPA: valine--tRNA ligase, partial [Candidatus Eremiobacteraceae bacterium]|nr:valine--tRNA ligase [Candidatus Eremiobacteraceae bacterium]